MTKNKDLKMSISFNVDAATFNMTISEPETGSITEIESFSYSPEKHKSFNETVGNNIYEWLNLWAREDDTVRNVEPIEEPCASCMIEEPADNALSEEGYQEPFPTF